MGYANDEKKRHFLINCAYFGVIILIAWLFLKYVFIWILPFIIGYLIAAIVQPFVRFMHKRLRINRKIAGVVGVLIFLAILCTLGVLLTAKLLSELSAVLRMLPALLTKFAGSYESISNRFTGMINQLPVKLTDQFNSGVKNLSSEFLKLSTITDGVTGYALGTASKLPGVLLDIIVTIVSACFLSSDYPSIRGFFMRQLPEKYQLWAMDIKEFFFTTVARLLRAYLTLMVITFAQLAVWLTAMRVPHSIMIAAIISVVDILPVLGTGTVVIPWAVIELVIGKVNLGLLLILMYATILIVRNVLEPKIVGYHIGLYPLVTLISMFVGLKSFGASGMILFPIIVIIIKHMQDTGKIRLWKT